MSWENVTSTFLIACENGHISDFPFLEWVHGENICENPDLSLESNTNPGLPGVTIKCHGCNKKRSLAGIYPKPYEKLNNVLPGRKCPGYEPWLGSAEPNEECNLKVDFIQRASSSAYFPHTISSILIPPYSQSLRTLIDKPRFVGINSKQLDGAKIERRDGQSIFNEDDLLDRISDVMPTYTSVYPIENIISL